MSSPPQEPNEATRSGARLADMLFSRLTKAAVLANGLGGIDVFVFLMFLLPVTIDEDKSNTLLLVNGAASAAYLAISLPLGTVWARRRSAALVGWLRSGEPAGPAERELALRQPLEFALVSGSLWGLVAILMGLLNAAIGSPGLGLTVAVTVALGGLSTSAVGYLLAERIARPVAARALESGPPSRPVLPGVTARLTMAWLLATGVPVLGVGAVSVTVLAGDVGPDQAAGAILFLTTLALGVGLLAIVVAARSVADPIAALRVALERVEKGDLDARARVDDGSEVGLLEAGFNRMAAGLSERERLRDLFGRHVGRDVARAALDGEVALGGEEREVAALFVDVVGSSKLAQERPAAEVVSLLNSFFELVVEVVEAHHGSINKFEGDGALCVFGAPVPRPEPAADALAAARELHARLRSELRELETGIGVSAGTAVAGNVGAEERFEYTIIGDPVNEAARLSDLAKKHPERLLASAETVARAGEREASSWSTGDEVTLRGRSSPTRLAFATEATPAETAAASTS